MPIQVRRKTTVKPPSSSSAKTVCTTSSFTQIIISVEGRKLHIIMVFHETRAFCQKKACGCRGKAPSYTEPVHFVRFFEGTVVCGCSLATFALEILLMIADRPFSLTPEYKTPTFRFVTRFSSVHWRDKSIEILCSVLPSLDKGSIGPRQMRLAMSECPKSASPINKIPHAC